jgi:hypothetical protein
MELKLVRETFTDNSTIGRLYNDDVFLCFTLEDMTREADIKIPGRTSIPYGRYEVAITFSPKFKCKMPILLNVPMFTFVRIHSGNDPDDTEACILVGLSKGKDMIFESRLAFVKVKELIGAKIAYDERVFITITKG